MAANRTYFFLLQTQNIFQAPWCHLQWKHDIRWPTAERREEALFGSKSVQSQQANREVTPSCFYQMTLHKKKRARRDVPGSFWNLSTFFWTSVPPLHQHKPRLRLRKTRGAKRRCLGSQYGTAGSPAWNSKNKEFLRERFGCWVVGSLQKFIYLWRNWGGSLELHLLAN